jgi:hypothetical protein
VHLRSAKYLYRKRSQSIVGAGKRRSDNDSNAKWRQAYNQDRLDKEASQLFFARHVHIEKRISQTNVTQQRSLILL